MQIHYRIERDQAVNGRMTFSTIKSE